MTLRRITPLLVLGLVVQLGAPSSGRADCLEQYASNVNTEALDGVSSNSLTHAQARDLIIYLFHKKEISFPPKSGFEPLFTADCKLRYPPQLVYPGGGASQRFSINGEIAGVRFYRLNFNANRTGKPDRDSVLHNLQPRMVIGLYNLALRLRDTYGVDEIYTSGIGTSSDGDHVSGVAIDFVGVHGSGIRTADNKLFVEDDWGAKPVPGPNGSEMKSWPDSEERTSFRLELPSASAVAREFFRDMYNFFAFHFAGCEGSPIGPKCQGDRLKHPDYYKAGVGGGYGRIAHKNHIHAGMKP
jgi:hypothetical protein